MAAVAALVRQLGKVAYASTLELQLRLAAQYKNIENGVIGEILLVEHQPPVYTFGLRQKDYTLQADHLQSLGAEVHKVRRGGLTTFHGPGQLVCYPILNLKAIKIGVRDYVHCLEKAVIATCTDFGVAAHTTNCTGVWVGPRKICAIGIQVSHGVSFHGLGLNCCTDLTWFDQIVTCGIPELQVTSLSHQLSRIVTPNEVAPSLVKNLTQTLDISYQWSE